MKYKWFISSWLLISFLTVSAQPQWEYLFNGENLDNWTRLNGVAPYTLEGDSVIVGTSVRNTPNTFLISQKSYGDFILEVAVKVDNELNSGIQIRSLSDKNFQNGRVHGYQVEIDPSARAFSGGLYDEARRGWMYPLSLNEKGSSAFVPGGWNHYHIEAIGNEIKVWVNQVMTTKLVDELTTFGFIALQVHSVYADEQVNKQVRWKNIRIATDNLEALKWTPDPDVKEVSFLINQLTQNELRKGWRLLWDGHSSEGWRGAKLDHFPDYGWQIDQGTLTINGSEGGEAEGAGDIITIDKYQDFELELEFKITKGANSGIKYFVQPEINKGSGSAIGCEFQILDDAAHPDAKLGVGGNRTLGSLYDLIPAENLSVPGREKQFKGIDQWNQIRIISKKGQVSHWLNGEKVVEYDRYSPLFKALVAHSKYRIWPNFGMWEEGHILLQDHGNTVSYRSVKIREF
ncbi:MAG: DUF1080 domain-containing protein [Flammeovirgaceae bacterium]|nr:DUF1080 domain-containing protein [Flammeovirgaceae bacterium]